MTLIAIYGNFFTIEFEFKISYITELSWESRERNSQKKTLDFHSLKNSYVEVGPRLKKKLNG